MGWIVGPNGPSNRENVEWNMEESMFMDRTGPNTWDTLWACTEYLNESSAWEHYIQDLERTREERRREAERYLSTVLSYDRMIKAAREKKNAVQIQEDDARMQRIQAEIAACRQQSM